MVTALSTKKRLPYTVTGLEIFVSRGLQGLSYHMKCLGSRSLLFQNTEQMSTIYLMSALSSDSGILGIFFVVRVKTKTYLDISKEFEFINYKSQSLKYNFS